MKCQRLRDEHGFTRACTIGTDCASHPARRGRGTSVPLAHPPVQVQADFGQAIVIMSGVGQRARACAMVAAGAPRVRPWRYPHGVHGNSDVQVIGCGGDVGARHLR